MKSYQQYCSVARALDVVGDRWVLLIVRELLAFGPSRYGDLQRGLPGIASNLLAERLKVMQAEGLIERYDAPPPVGTSLYQLTPRGRDLRPVLHTLGRWGLERMPAGVDAVDSVQPQWTALFAGMELAPGVGPDTQVVIGVEIGDEAVHVTLRPGTFEIRRGPDPEADVTVSGPAVVVGGVLTGQLSPAQGAHLGARITGTRSVLTDLLRTASRATDQTGRLS